MEIVTKVEPYYSLGNPTETCHVTYEMARYTRDDLESIQLKPSTYMVRPVADSYPIDADKRTNLFDDDCKMRSAFYDYRANAAVHDNKWWKVRFGGRLDAFWYKLYRSLFEWKAIA